MELRFDTFNVFNRVNLTNLSSNETNLQQGDFGQSESTNPPRNMQAGAVLNF